MSADTLLAGVEGWQSVKEGFQAKGKELTELLVKGAKGELTPEMEAYTQKLLEEVMGMATTISQAQEFAEATANFKTAALDAMSKGSFQGVISAFQDYSSQYESTIRETLLQQIEGWYQLADLTEDENLKAKYKQIADEMSAGFETTVSKELAEKTSEGRQMILDWLHETLTIPEGGAYFGSLPAFTTEPTNISASGLID